MKLIFQERKINQNFFTFYFQGKTTNHHNIQIEKPKLVKISLVLQQLFLGD